MGSRQGHIFNRPINAQSTKSLDLKIEHTPRAVVQLVIIYIIFLHVIRVGLWCLTPLLAKFLSYRGSQFYWWKKIGVPGENHRPAASH